MTTTIDPDGDLKLVVGDEKVTFLVDSRTLRRQSGVFKAMLFGGFIEASQGSDWTVELPEDDPDALEVVLNLVHANSHRLPSSLSLHELYSMVVLIDKYDFMQCCATFSRQMYSKLPPLPSIPSVIRGLDGKSTIRQSLMQMCIANELGIDEDLRETMRGLVVVLECDEYKYLVYFVEDRLRRRKVKDGLCEIFEDRIYGESNERNVS